MTGLWGWVNTRRITTRLTLGAAAVIAATLTLITVLDAREQRSLIRQRVAGETDLMARTLNDELANALYFSDIERLRHLGEVTATHAEIESIAIFDRQGRVLAESGARKFASGRIEAQLAAWLSAGGGLWIEESDDRLRSVYPISVGGETLGGILLTQDLRASEAEIAGMIRHHIREGLAVMLFAVALSYLLARWMVSPVKELMEVTRRIAGGDLDYAVVDRRDDELGDLAVSLEAMRRELKEAAHRAAAERTEELRRANERLRAEVAEREAAQARAEKSSERLTRTLSELSRVQQQVVQQERIRGEARMASGIAHDLSNTLQVILGVSQNLLTQRREIDDVRLGADLEMIAQASRDAAGVVARLRRVHQYGQRGRSQAVDVGELLESALRLAEPRRKQQTQMIGIDIRVVEEVDGPLTIFGSAEELRESLTNLIVNAIEAMPQGGTVTVRAYRSGGQAVVEVADDGRGMSEEVRSRAVEPFFSTKGQAGSGLGLTLVHGTVARHGGQVEIESAEERGTVVRIRFLLGATTSPPIADGERERPEPLAILVVDDEESVRSTVAAFLELDLHAVTAVGDGVAAAEAIERRRFDLVVTDRDMPKIDGIELAGFLRRRYPEIPVVMMSGLVAAGGGAGSVPEGVDRMLSKPIGLEELRQAIAELQRERSSPPV